MFYNKYFSLFYFSFFFLYKYYNKNFYNSQISVFNRFLTIDFYKNIYYNIYVIKKEMIYMEIPIEYDETLISCEELNAAAADESWR